MKKVAFVCDSSSNIGSGHFLRCFAIAEKFEEKNWDVYFIGSFSGPSWIYDLCKSFKFLNLNDLKRLKFDLMFIDSYDIEIENIEILSYLCRNIFFILDDKTPFFNNYNYISILPKKYLNLEKNTKNLYCGFEYTPIRRSIMNLKKNIINSDFIPKNIALMSGGIGRINYLSKFANELGKLKFSNEVLIFSKNKFDTNNIKSTFVKPSINAIDKLQNTCAVITTASVTSLEILYLGLPLAIYKIYENQSSYFDLLSNSNLAFGIVIKEKNSNSNIDKDFLSIFLDFAKHNYLKNINSESVVDGNGVDRIFDISTNSN